MEHYDTALVLQDGKCFYGKSIGKKGRCIGEVCFTTGMTGYQHTITDPSFADQIIVFTFPHIGNVGINHQDSEGKRVFASGVVVRELSSASHCNSHVSINDWLEENNTVGICSVDTRALTRYLRKYGLQNGVICPLDKVQCALGNLREYRIVDDINIVNKVSLSDNFNIDNASSFKYRVVIIDFGLKASIARKLVELGCTIELVKPMCRIAEKVLSMKPDGIVLSNGPGDPEKIAQEIVLEVDSIVKSGIPVFAICMGHQILAIAMGAKTIKMNNGHRGSNHPVRRISDGAVEITSQNHGFVVDARSLPDNTEVTHVSLFDNSVEGISLKEAPVFSVQYHPEEAPGTHDSHYLFEKFIKNMELYKVRGNELI